MGRVIDRRIKNSSIREMLYNIATVQNQIAFCQLTYLGKSIPTRGFPHPDLSPNSVVRPTRKVGRPLITNNQSMVRNIQLVIPGFDGTKALSAWGFHALDTQNWHALMNTLKHPLFEPPEDQPNILHEDREPPPNYAQIPQPPTPTPPSS